MKFLRRKGADRRMAGKFYLEVVKVVLLFSSETWVITPWMEKAVEVFHHQAVHPMAIMGPKRQRDGTWVYPPIGEALTMVGLD